MEQIEYEGFLELNCQVPLRNFNKDYLFLVVPSIDYHKEVPVIVGAYLIDMLSLCGISCAFFVDVGGNRNTGKTFTPIIEDN